VANKHTHTHIATHSRNKITLERDELTDCHSLIETTAVCLSYLCYNNGHSHTHTRIRQLALCRGSSFTTHFQMFEQIEWDKDHSQHNSLSLADAPQLHKTSSLHPSIHSSPFSITQVPYLEQVPSSVLWRFLLHWPRFVETDHVFALLRLVIFQDLHRLAVESETVA